MKLSTEEIAQFERDGYLPLRERVLDAAHLERLRERYDAVFEAHTGRNLSTLGEGGGDTPERMLQITEMWRLDEEFKNLLVHPPLLEIAESLIGPDIQLFHDQALYKPAHHGGPVPWHQDNGYWRCTPPNLVSIWMALDDADEENGCMNVIPRSHLEGAAGHERARVEQGSLPALLQVEVDPSRAVSVPVKAGYAMTHHCQTLHQTNPNRSDRRRRAMIIHYMPSGTRNSKGEVMRDNLLLHGVLKEAMN